MLPGIALGEEEAARLQVVRQAGQEAAIKVQPVGPAKERDGRLLLHLLGDIFVITQVGQVGNNGGEAAVDLLPQIAFAELDGYFVVLDIALGNGQGFGGHVGADDLEIWPTSSNS